MRYDHREGTVLIASSEHRFTFDAVSQLDRDTSTALVTIREWRNSLVPINRIPLEVLSMIPTHLSDENDLLSATSVCRHWRRTFIQQAALWSQLNLTINRSDFFVKTLLERAKGSALDIKSACLDSADTLALLSPHALKFRTLDFVYGCWSDIQKFSEAAYGPLPLLHTLKINVVESDTLRPATVNHPSLPLFSGAANLKEFILRSEGVPFLNHFAFPNLTTFELSATPEDEVFPTSQLLDFLEASSTLQTVRIWIDAEVSLGGIPPAKVIVLPNVEIFSITQDEPGHKISAHILCPSARHMSLIYEQDADAGIPQEAFPTSASWNAISPQYMANTVDEVVLGITTAGDDVLSCSLFLSSPGSATLELGYRMIAGYEDYDEALLSLGEKHSEAFSQACIAIRKHPLLRNVKRLRIRDRHHSLTPHQLGCIAKEAARLLKSMSPLEELTLDVDDLRPFLSPFFDLPEFQGLMDLDEFPSTKGLTIAKRSDRPLDDRCVAAILGFVNSQYTRGVPFERVVFHLKSPPMGMAERLEPWVGTVHFSEEMLGEDQDSL